MTDLHLRYPIGKPQIPTEIDAKQITTWLADFQQLPQDFRQTAKTLEEAGTLDTPYRPGGWTGRQVIHHVPDSHLNAYARFKIALTEDHPTVRPYDEVEWARLPDYKHSIYVSLSLLEQLHERLSLVLEPLTPEQWQRTYFHPGNNADSTVAKTLGHYVWHGRHHLGHLKLILSSTS